MADEPTGEQLTVFEYISRAIETLQKAELLILDAQRKVNLGQHPGHANEFANLKRYFDLLAGPLIVVAEAEGIDATGLDQFIRTGHPGLVNSAFQVLRRLQGLAVRKELARAEASKTQIFSPPAKAMETLPHPTEISSPVTHDMIDLDQAAALVNRSKRTLERAQKDQTKKMPLPSIQGIGGRKSEWRYSELKPWLETEYDRKLPDRPPHVVR
jgi:predicted DNA-binding transcriptional regulator AlpA